MFREVDAARQPTNCSFVRVLATLLRKTRLLLLLLLAYYLE
ncbi:MAG: hypothetical protein WKF84_21060 [Pyrinomonadaceae bacterium]